MDEPRQPQSLWCVLHRQTVPPDDVLMPCGPGVICIACAARLAEIRHWPDRHLIREVEQAMPEEK